MYIMTHTLCMSSQKSTYTEEQKQLKADFHQAVKEERLGEEEGGSLLTLRKKSQQEMLV